MQQHTTSQTPRPRSGLRLQLGTPVMSLEQLRQIHGEEIARRLRQDRRGRRLDIPTAQYLAAS